MDKAKAIIKTLKPIELTLPSHIQIILSDAHSIYLNLKEIEAVIKEVQNESAN